MTFTVYENSSWNYASVHYSACHHVRKHGGESRRSPPTGWYYDDIATFFEALRKALNTGRRDLALCSRCFPGGMQLQNWQRMNPAS